MTVVDTSAWIDYFRGLDAPHTRAVDRVLQTDRVVIGDLILAEFLQGFRDDRDFERATDLMNRLEYHDFVGREVALAAAVIYRSLRKRGVTVRKTIDVLIGTWCLMHGCPLIHNDHDFDPLETHFGLIVCRG
ncbi:MAG TPA: PIN domain nuclease [Spirochaetota bacterium]|nr:PIN domain nuclease [Spirochaetota bacterium]HPN81912.1 PIN domain nuclease [Spirochaetota bacterium]